MWRKKHKRSYDLVRQQHAGQAGSWAVLLGWGQLQSV
jgi:hypothetical protein